MPAKIQLFADHPALDFVNTLDNRFLESGATETLRSYDDLLSFVQESKLLDAIRVKALRIRASRAAAGKAMRAALDVREALASVFYGSIYTSEKDVNEALETLRCQFLLALQHQRLVRQSGLSRAKQTPAAAWVWNSPQPGLQLPVWLITQSAVALLTSNAMQHVHACASKRCRWLFLDTSKNHSRRWCDMAVCGNRMKAHRFHIRHEAK